MASAVVAIIALVVRARVRVVRWDGRVMRVKIICGRSVVRFGSIAKSDVNAGDTL